ncbi:MAG: hypothetical protein MSG64_17755 [Pyrinomonadaceae bacterium MAG19_C2-C3]|nr:hypothetical protein [Pyrinomonadaceae bacterium MAG19_C2-C3]
MKLFLLILIAVLSVCGSVISAHAQQDSQSTPVSLPLNALAVIASDLAYDAVLNSIPRESEQRPGARR